MLPINSIHEMLSHYGFDSSRTDCEKIRAYIALLLRWNEGVSLTTVTNAPDIVKFHFGESIFAAAMIGKKAQSLLDVGSGAGFPGLPLAIVRPDLAITLIESNAKKAAFL